MERKIGEIFECATGDMVVCERVSPRLGWCRGCIYSVNDGNNGSQCCNDDKSLGSCAAFTRSDGCNVVFKRIVTDRTLAGDIATLKRIVKEYPCKTIENVIAQLESRLSENVNTQNKRRRRKTTHI